MTIAFLWYWDKAEQIYPYWRDGLRAAIEEIGKEHDVDIILGEQIPEEDYDFYLIWGDSNCPAIDLVAGRSGRKGICLTTDPHNIENLRKLDVIFCESTPVYDQVRSQGLRAILAFGTDTDFFTPDPMIEKDIPYFYPATFSPWKRQATLAHYGRDLYLVGTLQPDGQAEYDACKEAGCNIALGYFRVEEIRKLYDRTQQIEIPAIHGSERTVLEAMSMGILPAVTARENRKAQSYLDEYWSAPIRLQSPREFVLHRYSAKMYADELLKGLCS